MARIHLGRRIIRSWIVMLVAVSLLTNVTLMAWSADGNPALGAGNDFTNIIFETHPQS